MLVMCNQLVVIHVVEVVSDAHLVYYQPYEPQWQWLQIGGEKCVKTTYTVQATKKLFNKLVKIEVVFETSDLYNFTYTENQICNIFFSRNPYIYL